VALLTKINSSQSKTRGATQRDSEHNREEKKTKKKSEYQNARKSPFSKKNGPYARIFTGPEGEKESALSAKKKNQLRSMTHKKK